MWLKWNLSGGDRWLPNCKRKPWPPVQSEKALLVNFREQLLRALLIDGAQPAIGFHGRIFVAHIDESDPEVVVGQRVIRLETDRFPERGHCVRQLLDI